MTPFPERDRAVVRHILERQARDRPDAPCVVFEDGSAWSFAEAFAAGRRAAAALAERGVGRADRVLVFLANGPEWLAAWWGTAFLGAAIVPVNTSYRGDLLHHVCTDAEARVVVVDPPRRDRLATAGVDLPVVASADLVAGDASVDLGDPVEPWEIGSIMYTSGTTGPSKGVLTPHLQGYVNATLWTERMGEHDRVLVDLPMYHIGGINPSIAAWTTGASVALVDAFSGSSYLDRIRRLGVTQTLLIGTMPAFLWSTAELPGDADTPWRSAMCAPLPPDVDGFCARFGIDDLWTTFGMTEISAPFVTAPGARPVGAGRLRAGYEVRLVDGNDLPVAGGASGELVIRHELPWSMNAGYHRHPEATARAWRNGWFHTGDAFTCDADGNFHFVDRMKDAIRRRGENISSFEVERSVMQHPAVVEAAAVGVPTPFGEEDVKVFVVVDPAAFDPAELIEHLRPRLPHFMVPRFVEVVDSLPTSANARVQKAELRARGNGPATWDRDAAGITVRRD